MFVTIKGYTSPFVMIKVSSPLVTFGCGSLRWSWSRELQRQQEFALKLERRAAATAGTFRWSWSRERQRPQRFALKLEQRAQFELEHGVAATRSLIKGLRRRGFNWVVEWGEGSSGGWIETSDNDGNWFFRWKVSLFIQVCVVLVWIGFWFRGENHAT